MYIITGRCEDGRVYYAGDDGHWVDNMFDAAVYDNEEAATEMAAQEKAYQESQSKQWVYQIKATYFDYYR